MRQVRVLHGGLGKWLVLALFIMVVTGLIMWSYPLWLKKRSQTKENYQ